MNAKLKNIIAMASFGTISIFVRNISLSSLELAFWRGIIAMIVLFLLRKFVVRQKKSCFTRKQKVILFLSGIAIGFNWVLLFMAYEYTSVAVATLAYYFAPVIIIVMCPILFKERMTRFQLFCFLMSTAGLFLVIGGGGSLDIGSMRGVIYGLMSAVLYATCILINKFIAEGDGLERTIIQFSGAVSPLFFLLLFGGGFHIAELSSVSLINLAILGIYHTGLCYWLYFSSIKDLAGQQTAILGYIDPFVAILVSIFFFHEPVRALQGVGAVLILGFTLLYEVKNSGAAAQAAETTEGS